MEGFMVSRKKRGKGPEELRGTGRGKVVVLIG